MTALLATPALTALATLRAFYVAMWGEEGAIYNGDDYRSVGALVLAAAHDGFVAEVKAAKVGSVTRLLALAANPIGAFHSHLAEADNLEARGLCPIHRERTTSLDGMYDGVCGGCEIAMYDEA
jgi:hypothetical protein